MNKLLQILFCTMFLAINGCKTPDLGHPDPIPDYEQHILEWQQERLGSLLASEGWFSLVGLFWLEEGENRCGSNENNQILLPHSAPEYVGSYFLKNGNVNCTIENQKGLHPTAGDNCNMSYKEFSWRLIERGGKYGVRVRDSLLPKRIRLRPIEYFNTDPQYRVYAKWTPAASNDSLLMRNVLDMEYAIPIEGKLSFTLKGKKTTLTALDGGPNELFLIISDNTGGESTYGGGRYLYCPRPNEKELTIIDFNKTHNPPCAFTSYATCLLPRQENHIELELVVGEKNYGNH